MDIVNAITYLICVFLLFLPFRLFERLLKKRQGEQRGYGDDNSSQWANWPCRLMKPAEYRRLRTEPVWRQQRA